MITEAWPTMPIFRGTAPLRAEAPLPTPEQLNASNPERRLIAAVAIATVVVCVPATIVFGVTMPNPELAATALPPPIRVVMMPPPPAPAPPPAQPARVEAAPAAVAPAAVAPAAPAVAAPPREAHAAAAPAERKASTRRKGAKPAVAKPSAAKQEIEIWPQQPAEPQDVRLAAPPPPPDDEPLKRPQL